MADRSTRPDVRNPVLALPAAQAISDLPRENRDALAAILRDLSRDARERAEKCWRTHKAPMALYWKTVAVDARHIALALRAPAIPTVVDSLSLEKAA